MLVSRSFVPPGGGSPTPPIPIGLTSPGATGLVADAGHVHAIQVVTTVERDALPTGNGRPVFNSDTQLFEFWNGARWVAAGIDVVNTAQRDAQSALVGRVVFNSTTVQFEGWNGASWVNVGIESVTTAQRNLLATVPGRTVFNSDTKRLEFYNSLSWVPAGGSDYTYRELCGRYVTALGNTGVEVAGLQTWNPAEHDLTNGRRVVLRAVFQSTGAFAARVRLFNRFFSNYVQNLDGNGNDFIQATGTTPQQYVSDVLNIVPHANFDTNFAGPYEVHVQSMDAGAQAVLGWAQLAVLPAL